MWHGSIWIMASCPASNTSAIISSTNLALRYRKCLGDYLFYTSIHIDVDAVMLICNLCASVQGIICSGSECDWPADGFLCPSAFFCTDDSFGTSSQASYWWSLAQILLLYCQPNGVPVFALYRGSSCSLYWYMTHHLFIGANCPAFIYNFYFKGETALKTLKKKPVI